MRAVGVPGVLVVALRLVCFCGFTSLAEARPAAVSPTPGVAIPDTPAGRQLRGWLHAFNSGDAAIIRPFIAGHYASAVVEQRSVDELTRLTVDAYHVVRAMDLRRIERSTDSELVALAQSRLTEAWWQITLQVEAVPPHGILKRMLAPATAPPNTGHQRRLSPTEIVDKLEDYLRKLVAEDMFSGTVLLGRWGKPIFMQAFGWADKSTGTPNRIDTRFRLASMGKMFTGVAIAQLAQQGKLSFSDPIGKYLPDYPNKTAAEKITLHHLLTHTSGLGDFLDKKEYQAASSSIRSVKDYFPFFAMDPLSFEPGQKWDYSNAGFIVLGAVIEAVTGQSYFAYIREHIYQPAGMSHTGINLKNDDVPNLAIGYTSQRLESGRGWTRVSVPGKGTGSPAGGGYSTVRDLLKFDIALRRHRLLNVRYTDVLVTRKVNSAWGGGYAYGFGSDRVNGERIVGHGGDYVGVSTRFEMYLDSGYTVVVLSNYDLPAAENVADKLRQLITQR